MQGLHHAIVTFAGHHAVLACVLAGVLASTETLPVLGALVPGTATIVAIAALVPSGAIPFLPLALSAAVGAMVGDSLSYAIGRRFGRALLTAWPLKRHPALLARAEEGVAKHGGKTLLVSRFTPGVRAIVPPLAGALGMPTRRFAPIIVAAGLIWAFAHVGLGVAIGAGLELLGAVAGRLALFVLVAGLLVWLTARLTLSLARRLPPLIAHTAGFLLAGLARGDSPFSRRLARVLASPPRTVTALVVMALLLAGGTWLVAAALGFLHAQVSGHVQGSGNVTALRNALSLLHTKWSDPLLRALAATGSRWLLGAVGLAVLAGLVRHRRSPTLWVAGLVGAVLLDAATGGAPAALEATLYGMLAYALVLDLPPPRGRIFAVPVVLVVVLAAFARVVLGLSLLAEEGAGLAFALAWVGLSGVADILRHHDEEEPATPGPASHAVAAALVALGVVLQLAGAGLVVPPAPADAQPPRVLDFTLWREGAWATMPAVQAPLLGTGDNPLVLQWAGTDAALARQLAQAGWHQPVAWTPRVALDWLLPQADAAALPVLPHLYRGEPPRLVLIHPASGPDERLVLRLWLSRTEVAGPGGRHALVVGTLSMERLRRIAGMLTLARSRHANAAELATLARAFPATAWVTADEQPPSGRVRIQRVLLAWPLAAQTRP
ncbi:MAG: VTT domain-containing protein [Rhodospirillales bacterium]|nr:VTT domain-containing protein [Rhodospirillales bacterium]